MAKESVIEAFEQPFFSEIPAGLNIEDTVIYTKENHLAPPNNPFAYGAGYVVSDITEEGIVVSAASKFHPMKHGDYAVL